MVVRRLLRGRIGTGSVGEQEQAPRLGGHQAFVQVERADEARAAAQESGIEGLEDRPVMPCIAACGHRYGDQVKPGDGLVTFVGDADSNFKQLEQGLFEPYPGPGALNMLPGVCPGPV